MDFGMPRGRRRAEPVVCYFRHVCCLRFCPCQPRSITLKALVLRHLAGVCLSLMASGLIISGVTPASRSIGLWQAAALLAEFLPVPSSVMHLAPVPSFQAGLHLGGSADGSRDDMLALSWESSDEFPAPSPGLGHRQASGE